MSIAQKVRTEFEQLPSGAVIASAELHRLSEDSQQVDKAVSRLFKGAGLHKLRNGLYFKPVDSRYFGALPPTGKAILESVRKQYKARLVPSGPLAAYQLGFTLQAPEETTYDTDKRIAPIITDNTRINFRQVRGRKLHSGRLKLVTLLTALEFLFRNYPELNDLQLHSIKRQLDRYPQKTIEKAIARWPRWFRDKMAAFVESGKTKNYITGISAFNIPYQEKLADWHQMGMLATNKFQIAGTNYTSAPGLDADELFDCSDFLSRHAVKLPLTLCAKPARAIKDILYTNIIIKNRYPAFLGLDQYQLSLSNEELYACVNQLRPFANQQQLKHLNQWLIDNDIH